MKEILKSDIRAVDDLTKLNSLLIDTRDAFSWMLEDNVVIRMKTICSL